MEFSILNESSLHKTLKLLYAAETNGTTEVKTQTYIYDVVTEDNKIIEIQTKNVSKLYQKIKDTLNRNIEIKLVHPVVIKKTIITQTEDGRILSTRKSPKKGSIYNSLKELTGLTDLLLNPLFTLELLEINMLEIRTQTEEPVQSKNKQRRFKKNWQKTDKKLDEILNKKILKTKDDYLSLLPEELPEEFSSKEIKECFLKNNFPKSSLKDSNLILWLFSKMNLIEQIPSQSRRKYFKIKNS